jgi:hypothetical protein
MRLNLTHVTLPPMMGHHQTFFKEHSKEVYPVTWPTKSAHQRQRKWPLG